MKKTPKSGAQIVTLVIIGLCVMFTGFIVFSYIQKKRPASSAVSGTGTGRAVPPQGSDPPRMQPAGAQAPSGGPQGGRNAGDQSPNTSQGPRVPQSQGTEGPGRTGQSSGGGGRAARNATAVRVTPVILGTIENSVVLNGDVLARTQVSIYPTVGGKLVEARFKVGDWVRRGDIVATVDPSRPGEVYSHSPVVSTVSGTILSAPVNPGDTLSVQNPVYVVGDLSSLLVETFVPERFATVARRGLSAQVSFEAIPEETFEMLVDEVNPVLDPASRTLRIRLRFTKQEPRIKAGMFATVSLVTNTRSNVPVIPRGAVINTYGSWIVFAVNKDNIAERREIHLGLESEQFLEVLSGLELGEQVVIAGQNFLTNGDPVRIVEG